MPRGYSNAEGTTVPYFQVSTSLNEPSVESALAFQSSTSRGPPLAARNHRSLGWSWCHPAGMPSMQTLGMPCAFQRGTGLAAEQPGHPPLP